MKLRAIHLFIILIASLILCGLFCSCFPLREGMEGGRKSTGDVALDVQKAGQSQAKADYDEYQAELAAEGLPTDPNKNYPSSNIGGDPATWSPTKVKKNIGSDPATWSPTPISNNTTNANSGANSSSSSNSGVINDMENMFQDAGKDIDTLITGNTSTAQTTTTTQNGYTTTTTNQPEYSYTGPAGDTVDVYTKNSQIPWYDTGNQSSSTSTTYVGPQSGTATSTTYVGPQGGTATSYTGPQGNSATTYNAPTTVNRSQIPPGDEDLYILKSQIVPPVCPACPSSTACPRQEPCQPCPPCARCPEPSFECKKVPNYSSMDNQYLPRPVLNDFSAFGM